MLEFVLELSLLMLFAGLEKLFVELHLFIELERERSPASCGLREKFVAEFVLE